MDSRQGRTIVRTESGIAFETKVVTRYFDLISEAAESPDPRTAYYRWAAVATFAVGMLEEALRSEDGISPIYAQEIGDLKHIWDDKKVLAMKKTKTKLQDRGGKVVMTSEWDSYSVESPPEFSDRAEAFIHDEKYDFMAAHVATWVGRCNRVFFGAGLVSIDDSVSMPFVPDDSYSENRLADDLNRRRLPIRLTPPEQR